MFELADMKVWQKARLLCVEAYRISGMFPPKERFRLTDQICRAGISVVNNIAEGFGRGGGKDFAYHLRVARGSVGEVRTCGVVACDLKYVSFADIGVLDGLGLETYKMLTALLKNVGGLT
ncbi:MAG TPA: four helix bundle protein [Planctomycetota bacterium]